MIRKVISESQNFYDIEIKKYKPISSKAFIGEGSHGEEYFIKTTELYTQEKFKFLYNHGLENILYPIKNKVGEFITRSDANFYVSNFINDFYMVDEIKAVNLSNQLQFLHEHTSFKRQLSPLQSRAKMDDIFEYLQYKFSKIEVYIRSLEVRNFDEFSIPVLKNYHSILDAKKVMATLQRKVISAIKEKKSVNYAFLHNNPKLDHLLSSRGHQYLISIEKSKIGIPSLDMAKFYIESESLPIDLKSIIVQYFSSFDDPFYFDYFCFLVLFIYIKGLVIVDKDYVTSQNFIYTSKSVQSFMDTFELVDKNKT